MLSPVVFRGIIRRRTSTQSPSITIAFGEDLIDCVVKSGGWLSFNWREVGLNRSNEFLIFAHKVNRNIVLE
jgi:hypothetical protein